METIVTVERGDVNKGATWNVAGKIGKTGKICAFCSATQKNDEILLVSGVCCETFVGVRRLKTVRFRDSAATALGEARFLVLYRRTAARDLIKFGGICYLRLATVVTTDAVAPVDGTPREKRFLDEITVE
jgi:hypothetical protein